jgi:hypothetical protein
MLLAVAATAACLVWSPSANAFSSAGTQRLVVIPMEIGPHAGPPNCPAGETNGCPRHSPAEWQQIIDTQLNQFYKAATWNQVNWNVRVLQNPGQADGWWPAPHTLDEYMNFLKQKYASFFSTTPPSEVSDAMDVVLGKAIAKNVISANEVSATTRFLVLTNWHGFGGQTIGSGTPVTYHPTWQQGNSFHQLTQTSTVSWANEYSNDDGASVVFQHELGHQLGEPDLYGDPCPLTPPGESAQTKLKPDGDCINSWDPMGLSGSRNIAFGYFARLWEGWVDPFSPTTRIEPGEFSGPISLSSIEHPDGDPVALHIPLDPTALILRRAFGDNTFLNGFTLECRRAPANDPIAPWQSGVLVTYEDSGQPYKETIVRPHYTDRGDTVGPNWVQWMLEPGDIWQNSPTKALVTFTGFDDKGGCSLNMNVPPRDALVDSHFLPAVAGSDSSNGTKYFGGTIARSVFTNPGVVVNGPKPPIPPVLAHTSAAAARAAVARAVISKKSVHVTAPVRGRPSTIRFAYGNSGAAGAGLATVRVEQPYVARPDCGSTTPAGRVVAKLKLPALAQGAAAVAQAKWKPKSDAPAAISVSLQGAGQPASSAETSTSVVGFQTIKSKPGRAASATEKLVLAVPRSCSGARAFLVNPAITPKGWKVNVLGSQAAIAPGRHRSVKVIVTAPKGAKSAATDLPIAITAAAPTSPLDGVPSSIFDGHGEPESAGGFDLLTRVSAPGRAAPAFVLPPFAAATVPSTPPPLDPQPGAPAPPSPPPGLIAQNLTIAQCSTQVVGNAVAVTVDGDLSPTRGNVSVKLTYTPGLFGPPTSAVTQTVTTDAAGHFTDQFNRQSNDWDLVASVAEGNGYAAAQSATCHVPTP